MSTFSFKATSDYTIKVTRSDSDEIKSFLNPRMIEADDIRFFTSDELQELADCCNIVFDKWLGDMEENFAGGKGARTGRYIKPSDLKEARRAVLIGIRERKHILLGRSDMSRSIRDAQLSETRVFRLSDQE